MARLRPPTPLPEGEVPAWLTLFDPETWTDPDERAPVRYPPPKDPELEDAIYREIRARRRWQAAVLEWFAEHEGLDAEQAKDRLRRLTRPGPVVGRPPKA